MYDIFYVSQTTGNDADWQKIKIKYPVAQRLQNITSYDQIKSKAFTKMFWVIWDDVVLLDSFNLTEYRATKWDDMYVHVFRNGNYQDGICLFPKSIDISNREFQYRFFSEKKEIDVLASNPKPFDKFFIKTYDDYLLALQQSSTEMFWAVWDDVDVLENFSFDYHVPSYNRNVVHIFKNGDYYDGLCLFPRAVKISKREFYHRFFTDKKEVDILASRPKQYNIYSPLTYKEYQDISDEMFWIKWPEIEVIDTSVFDLYFSHHNSYDRRENHIFKNLCNDTATFVGGLILCSKYKKLSEREFKSKYAVDKKEYNLVASRYRYPVYHLTDYDSYLKILDSQVQELFWGVWPEIEIIDPTIFDFYFDPNNGEYDHDRNENHVFKHLFNDKEIFINGLVLFSKNKKISQREFSHRFLITKKEHDRLVSKHRLYDVVFISYNEPNADENYNNLLLKCPRAKRVHGVKGIHQAHIEAAKLCDTDMIWIVDGDAVIEDNFNFDLVMSSYDVDCVHVWRSKNPINNLEYGYGGVKLLPRQLTLNMDINSPDMTTSISKKFKAMDSVSNLTSFNTDPFTTWRSAFRECAKLSSRAIQRHLEDETKTRLDIWCTVAQGNYSREAILGARAGRQYGEENKGNFELLSKINDFDWLKERFENEQRATDTNT